MRSLRTAAALALVAFVALLGGCGDDEGSDSGTSDTAEQTAPAPEPAPDTGGPAVQAATVDITDFKYKPATVTVKAGGTVEWTNNDTAPHTATADDQSFDTGSLSQGDAKKVTFDEAGTFAYICTFHPFMKATVEVVQ